MLSMTIPHLPPESFYARLQCRARGTNTDTFRCTGTFKIDMVSDGFGSVKTKLLFDNQHVPQCRHSRVKRFAEPES